jgi:hypothetical protein
MPRLKDRHTKSNPSKAARSKSNVKAANRLLAKRKSLVPGTPITRNFLAYWRPDTVDSVIERNGRRALDHAASDQFGRVAKGDTVWLVTIREGQLRLVTRIVVERVTGQAGAARLLGCRPAELWKAEYHIVAARGTKLRIMDTDISSLAPLLRFESAVGRDHLDVRDDGTVNPQQLQTMRELSPASANLLDAVISQHA